MKAGTTWLFENLRRHPEVFLPKEKELHYFDTDDAFQRPLRSYARHFDGASGKVKGEITPSYAILPISRLRFIRSIMPSVRLVFLMRDPVERAWSQLCMFLQLRERRVEDITERRLIERLESDYITRLGDYVTALDNWLKIFPRQQLFVGFYEQIREAPQGLLAAVFQHIGVSSDVDWSQFLTTTKIVRGWRNGRTPNPFGPCPESIRKHLARRYEPDYAILAERYGAPVERWRCAKRAA